MPINAEAAYLIVVGILLIIVGGWFYQTYTPKLAEPFNREPVQCNGTTFGISPSYIGALGEGKAIAHYKNGTVKQLGNFTWEIHVLNDACNDNYANVILKTSNSPVPNQYNVSLDRLSSVLIASTDLLALYGQSSGAVTGLGPVQAYQVDLQPRIVPGQDQGSYYYEFTSYYFDKSSGLLMRIESHRLLGYTNTTSSPDYILLVDTVKDIYGSTGPEAPYTSYQKATTLGTIIAFLSALYIIAGLILVVYGLSKTLF